jgi:hypothetical protein
MVDIDVILALVLETLVDHSSNWEQHEERSETDSCIRHDKLASFFSSVFTVHSPVE